MMNPKLYLFYGLTVVGLMGFAQYAGWSLASVNEAKVIPRSVRDNPGSYRSVYSSYHHYTGGK
ncbi:MAG TPA: hypothetical protein VNW97_06945 [Candidatus Saccharimonadales bacterium]|jgi:hypothetical protein|nr:hypothetical protein [Candidatus Saccharimonadales bacterium]